MFNPKYLTNPVKLDNSHRKGTGYDYKGCFVSYFSGMGQIMLSIYGSLPKYEQLQILAFFGFIKELPAITIPLESGVIYVQILANPVSKRKRQERRVRK